jgi:hypothetical protein
MWNGSEKRKYLNVDRKMKERMRKYECIEWY